MLKFGSKIWDILVYDNALKVDMPILTCIFFTSNWLILTSEMHFVKFHPEVASCLFSRGKKKVYTPGDEAIMKIHKKLFSGIPINFTFFVISPKLQRIWSWNFGFATRKIWASIWYQKMYHFWLSPGGWEWFHMNIQGKNKYLSGKSYIWVKNSAFRDEKVEGVFIKEKAFIISNTVFCYRITTFTVTGDTLELESSLLLVSVSSDASVWETTQTQHN